MIVVHADRPGSLPKSLVDLRRTVPAVRILQPRRHRLHGFLGETIRDAIHQALIEKAETIWGAHGGVGGRGCGYS